MQMTFRPLPAWPYPEQKARPATYQATYQRTLVDLERELEAVRATDVILGVVADPRDVRLDGQLRADAKVRHAGVELSFTKPGTGRVTFHTDRHRGYAQSWQDNLRAIALGLEALRAVDRYGITTGGQQYAGFAALSAGPSLEVLGAELVASYGGVAEALRATHPDTGSGQHTQRDFEAVMAWRKAQA
jgi:hypothetical protein